MVFGYFAVGLAINYLHYHVKVFLLLYGALQLIPLIDFFFPRLFLSLDQSETYKEPRSLSEKGQGN